jgi:hypothetical protein
MTQSNCKLNVFWANTAQDYVFNETTTGFLENNIRKVIRNSGKEVSSALFVYYAANEEGCEPYLVASMQELFGNIKIECIEKGREREMIEESECILVGGGNIDKLAAGLAGNGPALWGRVLDGTPFIGINSGASFLSSYFNNMGTASCSEFPNPGYFPIQFYPGFDPDNEMNKLRNIFAKRPELKYVLALPIDEEGSGIVLEESKTGLAGGSIDASGDGEVPGGTKLLYIFEADGEGGMKEVPWTMAQKDGLPLNYM